jgi:hypothetical protein
MVYRIAAHVLLLVLARGTADLPIECSGRGLRVEFEVSS